MNVMTKPVYFIDKNKLSSVDTLRDCRHISEKSKNELLNKFLSRRNEIKWDSVSGPYNLPSILLCLTMIIIYSSISAAIILMELILFGTPMYWKELIKTGVHLPLTTLQKTISIFRPANTPLK